MYRGKHISVVIPCHNEEVGIRSVMEQMPSLVDEVVVVDNCSTDNTSKVASELGARVIFEGRKGYGRAYKTGFAAARGDVIVTMDGDGTYPPDSIPLLLYVLFEEGVDFISARRWYSRNGETKKPIRLLGNAVLSGTMMILFMKFLVDSQSGMWVFKREILPKLRLTSDGMALSEEIKVEAFCNPSIRAVEMPIYYGERIGESKLNLWRDGFANLFFLFKKRFRMGWRRYRRVPLEVVKRGPEVEEKAPRRASAGS